MLSLVMFILVVELDGCLEVTEMREKGCVMYAGMHTHTWLLLIIIILLLYSIH